MKVTSLAKFLTLMVFLAACNRFENKAKQLNYEAKEKGKQLSDKAKEKGKRLVDTAINKILPDSQPDSFSIRSVVKDFQNSKDIVEIKGIQTDLFFLYVEYCVYRGNKERVLSGVSKIKPHRVNDYTSEAKPYPVSTEAFYHDIIPDEKTNQTAFFWNFEKLKSYEIYTCIKAPLRHYIIFDNNSDTVYHRIEELRD